VIAALPNVVVSRAPRDSVGIASGLYNSARTVAGAVAGAAFTAVMAGFLVPIDGGALITGESGYVAVWVICGALALTVAALALVLNAQSRPSAPAAVGAEEPAPAPAVA
jgi:MFS family permease